MQNITRRAATKCTPICNIVRELLGNWRLQFWNAAIVFDVPGARCNVYNGVVTIVGCLTLGCHPMHLLEAPLV